MKKKIVLIGAGSAMFTEGLVMDMIIRGWDESWELALVDTDPQALHAVEKLTRKMLAARQANISISATVNRREVLPGADFVVSTIGVGGRRAWEKDVYIPRKYGIYMPVGDSVAVGGISRAMRMIPAMVGVANDIRELCPQAYFFNFANPMTAICRAVRKSTGVPLIGLCHGVKNGLRRLSRFAMLDEVHTTCYALGVNHLVFIYNVLERGENVWNKILDNVENNPDKSVGPLSREMVLHYGCYPASDDRHASEFMRDLFGKEGYYGRTLGIDAYSFEETIRGGDEIYDEILNLGSDDMPLPDSFFNRFEGEHEQLIEMIESVLFDRRGVFMINVPVGKALSDLPEHAIMELPAVATAQGFMPMISSSFPDKVKSLLYNPIAICECTVDAALNGDKDLFCEAVYMGGYENDRRKISAMVDEMIEAQKDYLPQF